MKKWRFLSALCAFMISCAIMPIATADAEESVNISLEPVYEFPVVGEVYIYEGQNYHLGDYTEMNIRVQVFIEPDGNTEFLFLADEDFEYESDKEYEMIIDNKTRKNEHNISIDATYWCEIPYSVQYYDAIPITENTEHYDLSKSVYDNYDKTNIYYYGTSEFYSAQYTNSFSKMPISFSSNNRIWDMIGKRQSKTSGRTTINKNDPLGRARIEFWHDTIYVSEDQRQFIIENGEKQYIDDDMFVTFTIDDTSITKEIGLHYDDSPAMIYKQGDANNDGSLSVTDVVLLQKWLLADPDAHFETWCSADMNHDSRLDVFDLCLMKRALLDK